MSILVLLGGLVVSNVVVWVGGVSCCCKDLNVEHVVVGLYWKDLCLTKSVMSVCIC